MKLTPVMEKFVLHWGEMGPKWGINRSVAQVHALLYLSERPLSADEICEILSLARSNVSTSVRELQGWGIIRTVRVMGDRVDHFESLHDVWEMFRLVTEERKRREMDPTLKLLKECISEAEKDRRTGPEVKERLAGMLSFFEAMDAFYAQAQRLPHTALMRLLKMGRKVQQLLGMAP